MPPKAASGRGRGRPRGSTNRNSGRGRAAESPESSDPFESEEQEDEPAATSARRRDDDGSAPDKSIPADLLTRVLHEFFTKDATRISRDANAAVGKYVDIFVREAIARAAVEKSGGFLEVSFL